jgi:hypothetical protein
MAYQILVNAEKHKTGTHVNMTAARTTAKVERSMVL